MVTVVISQDKASSDLSLNQNGFTRGSDILCNPEQTFSSPFQPKTLCSGTEMTGCSQG